ncbi:hydrolase [Allostella sp. ATCC 35155]|nr:hydrolase [Stella sp. ATCC 35155]
MQKPPAGRAWQRMLSGRRLDLLDPSPLDVEIEDIALGLSRVARWNGQTTGAHGLSVAQHSLLVLDILEATVSRPSRELRRAALLHDASEFVTADLITPFKRVIGDSYKAVEVRVQEAAHLRFGLPARLPQDWTLAIKRADGDAAFLEAVALAGFTEAEARRVFRYRRTRRAGELVPWPAEEARCRFLDRFEQLRS